MKRGLFGFLSIVFALFLCMSAALAEQLSLRIHAQITLEGKEPRMADEFVIRMTAGDSANPMPNGQVGGICDLTIVGADSAPFPDMTFDRLGIYKYTIAQVPGMDAECVYDESVYNLTVSVVNGEGGIPDMEVAIRRSGMAEKTDVLLFHNAYRMAVPTPTIPPEEPTPTPDASPELPSETVEPTNTPEVQPVIPTQEPTSESTKAPAVSETKSPSWFGKITATGVADRWMLYVGGAAVLLLCATFIVLLLHRKEGDRHGKKK